MIEINLKNELNLNNIEKKVQTLLESKEFYNFLGDKLLKEVKEITKQKVTGNVDIDSSRYASANQKKVTSSYIKIFNDSLITSADVDESFREKFEQNYAGGLSLANIIEYGTGITGARSGAASCVGDAEEKWTYDVNGHGSSGWTYSKNGRFYKTTGVEGKLVYHTLEERFKNKINQWAEEFINKHKKDLED